MAESLKDFQKRTKFIEDSLPRDGGFRTSARLTEKVGMDGRFQPFFGDTVIFDLPEEDKAWLSGVQRRLYEACGDMLAEALDPASFHITLHDLNNGVRAEDVAQAMTRAGEASRALLAALPEDWSVRVRSTMAFSMVNTSVVLGFEPVDEADCEALMGLYEAFQQVVPLDYPLTPHVTLAYDRPADGGDDLLYHLRDALAEVNREMGSRVIRLTKPVYATFTDMNHYQADS